MFHISKSKISIKQSSMLKENKTTELGQEDTVRQNTFITHLYNWGKSYFFSGLQYYKQKEAFGDLKRFFPALKCCGSKVLL